jgi:L-threonylcarbamoyladenylate synthase
VRARIVEGEVGISESVGVLRGGGVVGLPTETVYGLAADCFNPVAIARIFEAKERPLTDPLIVHLPETKWLDRVVCLASPKQHAMVDKLAAAFWPGPMTLLLPKHPDLPELVTSGSEWVAVRVTSHPLFQEVLRRLDSPLAAPSANRFGRISPTSAEDVRIELGERISLILDGGKCEHGLESTILVLRGEFLEILRPGPITHDHLKEYGHIHALEPALNVVNSPGSLPGHYAPKKELQIINTDINSFIPTESSGLLAFVTPSQEIINRYLRVEILSPSGDPREAAANFYGALRRLDNSKANILYAEPVTAMGIGVAIMDRLKRASYGSKNKIGHQKDQSALL